MKDIESKKMPIINISFGASADGTERLLSFLPGQRNHCYVMGMPGTGKSILLKTFIESVIKNYDRDQVVVWTNSDFELDTHMQCESVMKICKPEMGYEDAMQYMIDRLHDEAQRRIGILSSERVTAYTKVDSLPLLIAVIDDFVLFDNFEGCCSIEQKLNVIMRMSHAVGMIIICASQVPVSRFYSLSPAVADLFNVRISLKSSRDFVVEALGIPFDKISPEINSKIDALLLGKTGDFLAYNRYDGALLDGRVKYNP